MTPTGSHSDHDHAALLDRFGDLAVWKRGAQRAPYKPLLVLLALGALERGERKAEEVLGEVLRGERRDFVFTSPRQTAQTGPSAAFDGLKSASSTVLD